MLDIRAKLAPVPEPFNKTEFPLVVPEIFNLAAGDEVPIPNPVEVRRVTSVPLIADEMVVASPYKPVPFVPQFSEVVVLFPATFMATPTVPATPIPLGVIVKFCAPFAEKATWFTLGNHIPVAALVVCLILGVARAPTAGAIVPVTVHLEPSKLNALPVANALVLDA